MKRWKPKVGESYWYIDANTIEMHWTFNTVGLYSKINIHFGNCFRTRKEAEKELKKIRGKGK